MSKTNSPSDSVSGSNEPSDKPAPPNSKLVKASKQTTPMPLAPTAASIPIQTGPRVLPSEELFVGSREIHIRHGNDTYRLMITRNDKLILQK